MGTVLVVVIFIAGIALVVYLLKHDARNADIANQNLIAVEHNALLAHIEQQLLIKHLGVKKAANVLLDAVENTPEAYSVLKRFYEQAGLDYDKSSGDAKSRTVVLRTMATSLQNVHDMMDDEIDRS
jgi:hypothetical protein